MKKIYISQPMRGRSTDAIIAERKALVADAAASEYGISIIHAKG